MAKWILIAWTLAGCANAQCAQLTGRARITSDATLCPAAAAPPASWAGILDPSRAIDWSQNHAGVYINGVAGIPSNWTKCTAPRQGADATGTVLPSGLQDMTDANNINKALQDCGTVSPAAPCNCYVQLAAGTFYIVNGLTFGGSINRNGWTKVVNNVILRGMGPDKTILKAITMGNQECGAVTSAICIMATAEQFTGNVNLYPYAGACAWTGGRGSTVLTVTNCAGPTTGAMVNQPGGPPAVGQIVILDQRNDDIGLSQCSSSGTTATCTVSLGTLPARFVVGACVGVGNMGTMQFTPTGVTGSWRANFSYAVNSQIIDANGNVQKVTKAGTSGPSAPTWSNNPYPGPSGTTPAWNITQDGTARWTLMSSYNKPITSPVHGPPVCNAITAVTSTTFSYTLPPNTSNLATIKPCAVAATCGLATVDTGGIFMSGVPGVTLGDTSPLIGRACPDARNPPTCQPGEHSYRSQTQVTKVVAVDSNCTAKSCQVTIENPVYSDTFRAEQAPGVYWANMNSYHVADGIEDLTIDAFNDGGGGASAITLIKFCYNCWMRNVRSLSGNRNHVWLYGGNLHSTFRDSYFFGTKRGSNRSYGLEFFYGNSDLLIENNLFEHVVSALMNGGLTGSVESYNYMNDDGYNQAGNDSFMLSMSSPNHDINAWNLLEGNDTNGATVDSLHGTITGSITSFRERIRAQQTPLKFNGLSSFTISSYNRGMNIVGDILGTYGWQNGSPYEGNAAVGNSCTKCIYMLGATSTTGAAYAIPDEPGARNTLLRWGNYDVATGTRTGSPRWCGTGNEAGCSPCNQGKQTGTACSEIPGAFFGLNANPVPANHNLPNSFYLSGMPGWFTTKWGTARWPPIGPDVTGGDAPDGTCWGISCPDAGSAMAYQIPAQIVANSAPFDPAYLLPNTVTSGTWGPGGLYGNIVTLHGTFTLTPGDVFKIQGNVPSTYDGTYMVYQTDAPYPSYQGIPAQTAGGSMGYVHVQVGYTYVRTHAPAGETMMGTINSASTARTCTTPTGSNQCQITITSLCGTGITQTGACHSDGADLGGGRKADSYNVYMRVVGAKDATFCKQNPTPIPLGTSYTNTAPLITPPCISPPTRAQAITATTVTYQLHTDPGSATLTRPGTIIALLIKVFNADDYYGVQLR